MAEWKTQPESYEDFPDLLPSAIKNQLSISANGQLPTAIQADHRPSRLSVKRLNSIVTTVFLPPQKELMFEEGKEKESSCLDENYL